MLRSSVKARFCGVVEKSRADSIAPISLGGIAS